MKGCFMRNAWRLAVAVGLSGAVALGTAACGSSSSSSNNSAAAAAPASSPATASASTPASTSSSPTGSCGTATFKKPQDPDGAFAKLSKSVQEAYNGYEYPVYASKWTTWKPSKPITVGISWDQPTNDFAAGTLATVENAVKAMPGVTKVVAQASASPTDIPGQIQQFESLLQQKPTMIIFSGTEGQPFVPLVEKAAKEGIPTISVLATVNSPDTVSVVPNTYLAALQTTEQVVKDVGGKGNALIVQGIPGLSINTDALNGIHAVLTNCPNIKVVGTLTGQFQPSVAKAQTISFLGTHPETVNAAFASGGVASGIISAFQQTGRSAPAITEQSVTKATLGYWSAHSSSFKAAATYGGASAFGQLVVMTARNMLAGDGVKVSSVVQPQPLVTSKTLSQSTGQGWSISTPGTASTPASVNNDAGLIKPLFNK